MTYLQVLPVEYGGKAKLLPVDEAVRAFKLPPFSKPPGVALSPGVSSADDATAEIACMDDDAQSAGKLEQGLAGTPAVALDAAVRA